MTSHCRRCNKQIGTAIMMMQQLFLVASLLPCLYCQAWIFTGGGSGVPPRQTRRIIGTTTTAAAPAPIATSTRTTTSTYSSTTALYVTKTLKRVRDSITSQERTDEDLKIGIAGFYDRSSALWLETWGEHMHHGYYIPANRTDHKQAQIDLIDQVLKWAHVVNDNDNNNNIIQSMVDVGCGVGGSSRHIAKMLNCNRVEGITLSPFQANKANEMAKDQNLQDTCHFQVADALQMPFDDNTFDLVWSLESGEHMPNKSKFVSELFRVAKPGTGRIILVTWCHRDLLPHETELTKREQRLLRKINRAYYLPKWCSVNDYVQLFEEEHGATDIKRGDWSYIIAPFWKAVIRSSLNWKSIYGLLKAGFSTQRGAYAMFLMLRGFNQGLIKFGLLTCTKPPSSESESSSTIQQTKE